MLGISLVISAKIDQAYDTLLKPLNCVANVVVGARFAATRGDAGRGPYGQ